MMPILLKDLLSEETLKLIEDAESGVDSSPSPSSSSSSTTSSSSDHSQMAQRGNPVPSSPAHDSPDDFGGLTDGLK